MADISMLPTGSTVVPNGANVSQPAVAAAIDSIGTAITNVNAESSSLTLRNTRAFTSRANAEANANSLPASTLILMTLEGADIVFRRRDATTNPLTGTTDPWGEVARLDGDLSQNVAVSTGLGIRSGLKTEPLILDASGQVIMEITATGVNFKAADELIAQWPTDLTITGTPTLSGIVVMTDTQGRALLNMLSDGFDFQPSGRLIGRIGYGAGLRSGLPSDAHAFEQKTIGGVDATLFTSATQGSLLRYAQIRQTTFISPENSRIELLSSNGQSLAVGTDFTGSGENRAPIDHLGPYQVFDITDGQEVRGWQSANGASATSNGLRVAPLPTVRQTPIATTAAALADIRRKRALPQRPMIVRNHGYAGQSYVNIDSLSGNNTDAGNVWPTFLRWLTLASGEASAYGMTPRAYYHVLIHGTADATKSKSEYRSFLDTYGAAVTAAAQAATGQTSPVKLVLTQDGGDSNTSTEAFDIKQAQLEYAGETSTAILAGPLYPYPIWDAAVHPGVVSTVLFSEIIAHAIAADEAGEPWTIAMPTISRSGATITVDYSSRLRGDELLAIAPDPYAGVGIANLGFEYSAATISSVTVSGAVVTINLASTPGSAGTLTYALQQQNTSVSSPGYTAHRGRLRTTWFAPSFHVPGSLLYRWIPSFKGTI